MSEFLHFNEINNPGRKTRRWEVLATADDGCLGGIYWYAPWRKHVFLPYDGTLYDPSCLRTIAEFTERVTKEHKDGN